MQILEGAQYRLMPGEPEELLDERLGRQLPLPLGPVGQGRVAPVGRDRQHRREQGSDLAHAFRAMRQKGLQLVQLGCGRIVTREARRALELLDEGMEGGAGVEGRALVAQPQVRRPLYPLADGPDGAGLADARLARQQNRLALAVLRPPPAVEQQGDLLLPPDQGRQAGRAGLEPAFDRAPPDDAPGRHRVGETLQHLRPEIVEFEPAADQPPRGGPDHDRIGSRQGLQPGREVGRVADDRLLLGRALADQVADHDQPGGNSDPRRQGFALGRAQPSDGLEGGQAGEDRPLGVVLVRPGPTEVGKDAIAHELRDVPPEARDRARHRVLVGAEHLPHLLGVEPRRERGGGDQVGEHDRELPPLGASGPVGGWLRWGGARRGGGCSRVARAQGGDRVEQLAPVANRGHAEADQVVRREPGQQLGVDVVVAERRGVAPQAQAFEPSRDVHEPSND